MNFRNDLIKQTSKTLKAFAGNPQENFANQYPIPRKILDPNL